VGRRREAGEGGARRGMRRSLPRGGSGRRRASERCARSRNAVVCWSHRLLSENKTLGRRGRPDHPSRHLRAGHRVAQGTDRRGARLKNTTPGSGTPRVVSTRHEGGASGHQVVGGLGGGEKGMGLGGIPSASQPGLVEG
jgi:hypothetical protein